MQFGVFANDSNRIKPISLQRSGGRTRSEYCICVGNCYKAEVKASQNILASDTAGRDNCSLENRLRLARAAKDLACLLRAMFLWHSSHVVSSFNKVNVVNSIRGSLALLLSSIVRVCLFISIFPFSSSATDYCYHDTLVFPQTEVLIQFD